MTDSILNDDEDTLVRQFFGPPTDLALQKDVSSSTVLAGDLVTYTVVITNYGPATATDVKVVDALPAGLEMLSATSSQGLCDSGITCLIGEMPYAGTPSNATITIVARVAANMPAGSVVNNAAMVQGNQPDEMEENNLDDAVVGTGALADLRS